MFTGGCLSNFLIEFRGERGNRLSRCRQGLPGWQAVRQKSIAEIFEIGGDTEVTAPHKLDYRLQIVFLFSGDANLSILQLALHFEPL